MMKFGLREDTTTGSKLAKWSRFTRGNMSSPLNECSGTRLRAQLFIWAFTPARWLSLDESWTKDHKFLEHKAKSRQVGKENRKYKEETTEKIQR